MCMSITYLEKVYAANLVLNMNVFMPIWKVTEKTNISKLYYYIYNKVVSMLKFIHKLKSTHGTDLMQLHNHEWYACKCKWIQSRMQMSMGI